MSERKILNLTQHSATPEQLSQGVVEPSEDDKIRIQKLLTFEELPERHEIYRRAAGLAAVASCYKKSGVTHAMIGGAPYLMPALAFELKDAGILPVAAFSNRISEEKLDPETGEVKKTQVFKHLGFVRC